MSQQKMITSFMIVELFFNNKADPNICCEGDSPLYTASRHGHTEIVEL
jgi:ankyrin repeat protein